MKNNKIIALLTCLLATSVLVGCGKKSSSQSNDNNSFHSSQIVGNDSITISLNKDKQLDGGEIEVEGLKFHFDENSVNEHPENAFIEIGPYGSLYLENYIPGLTKVYAEARREGDYYGEFFLGSSSTPNAVEEATIYTSTGTSAILNSDKPYFSIHNRADNKLFIARVDITYQKPTTDPEPLRSKIQLLDQVYTYDSDNPIDPYKNIEIDPKDIPDNRYVMKINGEKRYVDPGKYTFGYEVYNKNKDGTPHKMLYSSIAELTIQGSKNRNHLAIFHLPEENVILEVANHQKVDISNNKTIASYNWNSPINDFETPFYGDRHYYPTFSVVGVPSEKDGDGCYPVTTTYTLLEKSFTMPEPQMKEGYQFGGWYLDHQLTKLFDPEAKYTSDLTLYAKCIETNNAFKRVYYHDYDGSFLNRLDILYEGQTIALPKFKDIGTGLNINELMYEVRMGTNRIGMLMPEHDYDQYGHYNGDKLSYDMVNEFAGDVHLYVSKFEFYYNGPAQFTRIFEDSEHNTVISGLLMPETQLVGDFVMPGRYVQISKPSYKYDFTIYDDPTRSDEFLVTDEIHGYIIDQGSYNSICTYGYGNKNYAHSKPLEGILRHESVLKVGRRAFFNRYGLMGTYFPRNAIEFDNESYANTTFNDVVLLPKNLQKIGQRAFMGSKNIKYVALPKTISSIGKGAFSLGKYDESTYSFKDIEYRTAYTDQIIFYYEGTEEEFNRLDEASKAEITNNSLKIVFEVPYTPYYGR